MAHFAELDDNNNVIQVIVVNNEELLLEDGTESEDKGVAFIHSILGDNTSWVQTSYNGSFRGRYAGVGMYYDKAQDVFLPIGG